MTPEQKATIDGMTQLEMARTWRFAEAGHQLLQGDTGEYFTETFKNKGGMTTAISKELGWGYH